jgi:hypothetical protein
MALVMYAYQRSDHSLAEVASRFGTTVEAIRNCSRNPGPVLNWPHDIDDPAWGTREIDYGATLIVPVPDSPSTQDESDLAANRRWSKYIVPAGTMLDAFYEGLDQSEGRKDPFLLGDNEAAAYTILNNWRNIAFKSYCDATGKAPPYGLIGAPGETVTVPALWIYASADGAMCVSAAPASSCAVLVSTLKPVELLADKELGPEHEAAIQNGNASRQSAIEVELLKRISRLPGTAMPQGAWPGVPANVSVTPEVALKILDNYVGGEMPWRPDQGTVGQAAWFVTEGNPYTGPQAGKTISLRVEVKAGMPRTTITLAATKADEPSFQQKVAEVRPTVEAQIRERFDIKDGAPLFARATAAKAFARRLSAFAESRMWTAIGERAAASPGTVIMVSIPQGEFSEQGAGTFAVVADRDAIRISGGPTAVGDALKAQGVSAEPVVAEAAEVLATRLKWAGRVRGVFRYGGRVMIVLAVAGDLVKIYYAKDHVKAVVESVGGWAGATAAGAAFAAWWTPADVAGPWAWAGHGVGTLVAGGVGYWVGSSVTRTIYELVAEGEPEPGAGVPAADAPESSFDPADGGVGTGPDEDDE